MASPATSSANHRDAYVRALMQHERVMEEQARVLQAARQARQLAAAKPIFATADTYPQGVRSRVEWVRAC